MQLVVTNNPRVAALLAEPILQRRFSLRWIDGCTEQVFEVTRNLCHAGHRLLTHPLTGSIKPNQTPYKTVVLEPTAEPDAESIRLAEISLAKTESLLASWPRPASLSRFADDFALIDLDFFQSYLQAAAIRC